MTIRKALITAAGFGTRFLPVTKSVQKEMLPILNRPTIDYLVDDCVKAGVQEIILVVKEGDNRLVDHYYTESQLLEEYLVKMGKLEQNAHHLEKYQNVKFTFVEQSLANLYGTAVPVTLVKEHLQEEDAFVVLMGDDFLFNQDGSSETERMINYFQKYQPAVGLVTCIPKPTEELFKYGVAKTKTIAGVDGVNFLENLIEKPDPENAPSNLINISKYILTPEIFEIIEEQQPNPSNGELYITDSVAALASAGNSRVASQNSRVLVYEPKGTYLDSGTVPSWLKANLTVAAADPELKKEIGDFLSSSHLFEN